MTGLAAGVAAAAGLVAGAAAVRLLGGLLSLPALQRRNHRGRPLPTAGGLPVIVAVTALAAGSSVAVGVAGDPGADRGVLAAAVAALGFGALGLLDDVLGEREGTGGARGLRGHLAALRRGRLTTGTVKLAGGPLVAVLAVAALPNVRRLGSGVLAGRLVGGPLPPGRLLLGAAVVALAANLANLLDRAPGRATKATLLAGAPVVVAGAAAGRPVAGAALALGALAATLPADLGERLMLGDTGANVAGAAAGLAVVATAGPAGQAAVLAVLVALTLASERWSFSRVVDRVPPLRWLDRLGRPA